jgi:AI-2 transport protein TqsA
MIRDTRTTNILLLIIVIPLIFYLLKTLSFIFIPLISAMFISLLFLPLMRWLKRRKVSKPISIGIVILLIAGALKLLIELIQLSTKEILSTKDDFLEKVEVKLTYMIESIEAVFGVQRLETDHAINFYLQKLNIFDNFGSAFESITGTITTSLMIVFFVVLLLSESINLQKILDTVLFKSNHSSVKTFVKIERDIIKFVGVKFIISLLTGVGFTLACIAFDVSFPIFWGLFAFVINFVQMVGSVISVVLLTLFAIVEIDTTGTLLFFILVISGVQVLMGGILEPVFMGKTFSINVITVLIMLMFWGYIWGIPGLIMSIPITVFIKIILSQFPKTRVISNLMDGSPAK